MDVRIPAQNPPAPRRIRRSAPANEIDKYPIYEIGDK